MSDDAVIIQPIIPTVVISSPGPQGPGGGEIFYVHTHIRLLKNLYSPKQKQKFFFMFVFTS